VVSGRGYRLQLMQQPSIGERRLTLLAAASVTAVSDWLITELAITWSLTRWLAVHAYTTCCCLSGRRQTDSGDIMRSNYMAQDSCR